MFDFPSSPALDQTYTAHGVTYRFNGYGWVPVGSGATTINIGDAPPSSPLDSTLWYETDTGILWVRLNDGNSTQWTSIAVPPGPTMGFLPLAGGTLTGLLTIAPSGGTDNLTLSSATTNIRMQKSSGANANNIWGMLGTLARWVIVPGNNASETGSNNEGSDFIIARYRDDGSYIDLPFTISRSLGACYISNRLSVGGSTVPSDAAPGTIFCGQYSGGPGVSISSNTYWNTNWKYYSTNPAALMSLGNGYFEFWTAPSGTIGATTTITLRFLIGNDGEISATPNNAKSLNIVPSGTTQPALNSAIRIGYGGGGLQYGISYRPTSDSTYPAYFYNAAGTSVGTIGTSATTTTYATSSDRILKEDLQSFDAGQIIDNTKVYNFAWKTTGERAHGVFAQEAIEVYSEAVVHSDDEQGEFWGIDYSKYVPILLQELKSLRQRVAILEGRAV